MPDTYTTDLKCIDKKQDSPYEMALKFVLHWEGGYSNHPADRGGATNFGISYRFLQDQVQTKKSNLLRSCGVNPPITNDLIKSLTLRQVFNLYRTFFWLPCACEQLPFGVAMFLFDAGVNCGNRTSCLMAQRAANVYIQQHAVTWPLLAVDGKLGNKSLNVLREIDNVDGWQALHAQRVARYDRIIASNPSQKVFEKGWKRRADALLRFVNRLYTSSEVTIPLAKI